MNWTIRWIGLCRTAGRFREIGTRGQRTVTEMSRWLTEAPYDQERRRRKKAGEPHRICRWCGTPLDGRLRSWCSNECEEEYAIRSSGSSARWAVENRDHGICSVCGMDCIAFERHRDRIRDGRFRHNVVVCWPSYSDGLKLDSLRESVSHRWRKKRQDAAHVVTWLRYRETRARWFYALKDAPGDPALLRRRAIETWERFKAWMVEHGWPYTRIERGSLWDVDHILPVEHGGGGCGLENLRTLCVPCHKAATKKQAGQRSRRPLSR